MPEDVRKVLSQTNSLVTTAMARYSASTEDLETLVYFLVF